ncbi:MAG TPA: ATP-binding protein [Pseudomonadales bacterium]|nr:ATP-binding protein [Pseudomonadales bacterium]
MQTDPGVERIPERPIRLFLGVLASWLAPSAIFVAYVSTMHLVAPFSAVNALDPVVLTLAVFSSFAAAFAVAHYYRRLRRRDQDGVPAAEILASIRRLMAMLPAATAVYVIVSAALLLRAADLPAWSGAQLLVAAVLALMVMVQILVPLALLCMDEFGIAFGHLIEQRRVLPSALRSLPVLFVSLMYGFLIPIHEYLGRGELSSGAIVLVSLLVPYATMVTLVNLRYTRGALSSMVGFVDRAGREGALDTRSIRAQALDDIGVLIAGLRRLLERVEGTRRSLTESETRLRMFAEASSDWFFETDEHLEFSWVSERVEGAIGVPARDIVGLSMYTASQVDDTEAAAEPLADIAARRAFRDLRTAFTTPDGERLFLRLNGVPVHDADGHFSAYRGTGSNITAIVEAEQRLRERETQLAQAQKMEAVGQLTGGIAHDFNNLLTAVAGNLELLGLRRAEFRDEPLVRHALDATRRAGDLVQHLLAFSRRQELRPVPVHVAAKIGEMAELLRRTLGAAIILDVDLPEDEVWADVDPVQLESALLNLALNARDAMAGGGRLGLAVSRVAVTDDADLPDGDYARVLVSDTGSGIDPDTLLHVFEPFFSTKAPGAGSGLGLSMVYGFVRQSEGAVRIASALGIGTRVTMYLPCAERPADAPAVAAVGAPEAPPKRALRVLVVEDEASVRKVVRAALERIGWEVEAVADADAALQALETLDDLTLVLSDVVLPGPLSGVDVVRRARELMPGLPCILMSGYAREHITPDDDDIRSLPMLQKPFPLAELEKIVTDAVAEGPAADAAVGA